MCIRDRASGLRLLYEPDGLPSGVLGDEGKVGQIVLNLLGNAVKFTERGEVTIRVRLAEMRDDGPCLRLSVTDTGIGITDDQRGRLFRSFEQADSSTTRKFGGTGLGLAISKRLAELMGGSAGALGFMGTR